MTLKRLAILGLVSFMALSLLASSGPSVTASHPSPRGGFHYEADYDDASDRMVLFGGWELVSTFAAEFVDETWTYDLNTNSWTRRAPPVAPSQRFGPGLAYDNESDRTILFGGQAEYPCVSGCTYNNQTWSYDDAGDSWMQVSLGQGPGPRSVVDMAYDAQSDRIILFGGTFDGALGDTWAYDFNNDTWIELSPVSAPPARFAHSMAYDSGSDRIILFGGLESADTSSHLSDIWAYHYETNTWTPMASGPSARFEGRMAYDSESDRIILFGGERDGFVHLSDTWVHDFSNDRWTQMDPSVHPAGGTSGAMAYDGESDRVILFGGQTALGQATDATWAYDFNTNTWTLHTHPGPPQNLEAVGGDGVVNLTWELPFPDYDAPIIAYRISRGTVSGGLSFLAEVVGDRSYSDETVTNGVIYYYQLTALNDAGEGPPSAEIPATPEEPPEPPDTTDPTIEITFPQNGATLTDVTVTVTGTASDDIALQKVELSTDGVTWQLATGTTTWSLSLTLDEGSNTLTARATDTSGNTVTDSATVEIVDPPAPDDDPEIPWLLIVGIGTAAAVGTVLLVLRWRRR